MVYKLVFPSLGKVIPCNTAAVPIGRTDLNSPMVSALHAIARKQGPETKLQLEGRNGTCQLIGNQWIRLEKEVVLEAGLRLRFADVECLVEELV